MRQNTHLADSIDTTEYESQYDECAKELVSDKQVLARIMKGVVTEFKDYDISVIEQCIEGQPEVSNVSVYPGKSGRQKITGTNVESKIRGEGELRYDIRFYAVTPEKKERIKIILNVELQKKYRVGYDLVTRGIVYCARMLSQQKDTEYEGEHFEDVKKVYSIWICTDSPEKLANTITEYKIERNNVYGEITEEERYDLMSVIMIRLSGKGNDEKGNLLIKMLTTLLSDELNAQLKKKKLIEEHGMRMKSELEGEMEGMGGLGEGIREKGIAIGVERGKEIGKEIGKEMERCATIRNLQKVMKVPDIVSTMKYEESFVASVFELIEKYPNASDQEIVQMLKEK